ncbi:GNAT family N-acetyltransferase [Xanthobacter sp. V4C-4]|uniref:GNAT family N-acetyltransferase n=1 Tax=Xanthobacter cornucopiae TaxID=3119924 RepID=UPI003728187D
MPDFATLLDAHIAAQSGCYVSGVDFLPDGGRFLWSERLGEPSLNLGVGTEDVAAVRAAATARGRLPALLAADEAGARRLSAQPGFAAAFPTAWMVAPAGGDPPGDIGLTVEVSDSPRPSPGFCAVARGLYDDPQLAAAAEIYVSVLDGATGSGASPAHLVLRDGERQPVAAASLYRIGALAGLYNVGTLATHRGRGLGQAITRAALALAAEGGARSVFLQCAPGPVEHFYARLGFVTTTRPVLACFGPGDGASGA